MPNLPALTPTTFAEALQFATELAKSTMVPRDFQRNPANILVAIQWGAELGLSPLQALQNIAVINGKPSVYGDALLALVRGSPLCKDVLEHIDGEGNGRTAICEAHRKGTARPVIGKFSVDDAKRAGLWGKAGPWTQYPDRMLQMRARTFALRDAFPDVLRGVISAEEAADAPREPPKDITPSVSAAAELDAFAAETDVAPDQAEVEPLLIEARNFARQGIDTLRMWYRETLDDDQRLALRPHIKALQNEARAVGPNQGETDMSLAAATDAASASSAEVPDGIPIVLPTRGPTGRGTDWVRFSNDVIAAARIIDPMHMHEFRVRNATPLNSLRLSNKEEWERVTKTLAALERGEDTEDERKLEDDNATMT